MSNKEISTRFDVAQEPDIFQRWAVSGTFQPTGKSEPFAVVIPPPNVTGDLHMGHALVYSLHDIIARHQRRLGKDVLLLPGADHASIAVEMLVTKQLEKAGKRKSELGREKFLEEVWRWIDEYKPKIISSLQRLGLSADWKRFRFTMDDASKDAVEHAFTELYKKDLIYRGQYIVNWDPKLQTVIADDELEWKEESTPLYYLKYGPFTISTARPETKFGDKYVVMHPDDARYSKYTHGQQLEVDWLNGKITATIIKDSVIDMEFGTGVMTITPWHDQTDFELAKRHHLMMEPVIDQFGKLLPIAGEFAGEKISTARSEIVKRLDSLGLLVKTDEKYVHRIATNGRGGGIVEPQVQTQWFMRTTAAKKEAIEAVKSGKVKFYPKSIEKVYFNWLNHLHDWCISRQLWWGHQIPAYYTPDNEVFVGSADSPEIKKLVQKYGDKLKREEDVLDTWFSSALWPLTTLGWPKETADFKRYFPTSLLITGADILFFWVARMIIMSVIFKKDVPFKEVYFHGLVLDGEGQKMSKTKGNVVEPLELIEKYGADALRMSVVGSVGMGQNQRFSEQKLLKYRNFTTKIWNASRYVALSCIGVTAPEKLEKDELDQTEQEFLKRLEQLEKSNEKHFSGYQIGLALEELYDFFWHEFADKIVEYEKIKINENPDKETVKRAQELLLYVLNKQLTLISDFAPFLTDEITNTMFKE